MSKTVSTSPGRSTHSLLVADRVCTSSDFTPSRPRSAAITGLIAASVFLWICYHAKPAIVRADDQADTDYFERKIRPIFVEHCYECHSAKAKKLKGGLRLDTREGLRAGGDSGPALVPGKPEESLLIKAIAYTDDNLRMPPRGKLPGAAVAELANWIRRGAHDPRTDLNEAGTNKRPSLAEGRTFWSFQPPRRRPVPRVADASWPQTPVDTYILAALEASDLRPAPDADRFTLLRRITIDLTGLLPTPGEIDRFTVDQSAGAWMRVVDRLLNSPAFGDRWGRHWLDLVQYADTVSVDRLFPDKNAWRYRDYVIRSLNEDRPYDRFVREQVAGDLLPASGDAERRAHIVATAFWTHGPYQTINQFKEQLRWDIVDSQVMKLGQVFLGLTLQCARCHDHKFDPVSQNDYYALAGIAQNLQVVHGFVGDSKVFSEWVRVPLPESQAERTDRLSATKAHERTRLEIEAKLTAARDKAASLEKQLLTLKKAKPTTGSAAIEKADMEIAAEKNRIRDLENQLIDHIKVSFPEPPSMFAAKERVPPGNARITIRGNAYQPGAEVARGFIEVVSARPGPAIPPQESGRRQLADWLTDPANPLTARVMVNRIWQHLFGAGLVRTADNFGLRGDRPTHPELLDYLATRFAEQGWSVKRLIRELVLSRAYQMASGHNAAAFARDPENKLLWRMPRRRLSAEAIRDGTLQLSGQLDRGRGGPCLPRPGWLAGAVNNYVLLIGEPPPPENIARRRTIYLPVYRRPPPWADGVMLFDGASPSVITGTRAITTVPAQALYLMNSPFVQEQSRKTAERLLALPGVSSEMRVARLITEALGRPPRPEETARAIQFIKEACRGQTEVEAWAGFCHAVLVSNEFLWSF